MWGKCLIPKSQKKLLPPVYKSPGSGKGSSKIALTVFGPFNNFYLAEKNGQGPQYWERTHYGIKDCSVLTRES